MNVYIMFCMIMHLVFSVISTAVQKDNFSDFTFPSQDTMLKNSGFVDSFGLPYASIVIPSSVLENASLSRKCACKVYIYANSKDCDHIYTYRKYSGCSKWYVVSNNTEIATKLYCQVMDSIIYIHVLHT